MTSEPAKATPGGRGARRKTAKSPHAPVDPFRSAAVLGGVTDKKGKPTAKEKAAAKRARERNAKRDPAPFVKYEKGAGMQGPYPDADANQIRMLDVFGTNSKPFLVQQMGRLIEMLQIKVDGAEQDVALNSCLAIVAALKPENEIETSLAVQIAGTHELATEMLAKARRASHIDHLNAFVTAATKLQRTHLAQLEALGRLRGKGQQTVRVEHVTIAPGGQAIVGDVHHHQHQPPAKETSDALPAGTPIGAALPSPDPIRQTVPRARDEEWAMQDARREEHWRAEG